MKPTVISVMLCGDRCQVITQQPGTQRKLQELQSYLLKRPEFVNQGNLGEITGKVLALVDKPLMDGTHIFNMNFAGPKKRVGRLAFFRDSWTSQSCPFTWRMVAEKIDSVLEEASELFAREGESSC
jgi:hypothetical protein